MPKFVKYTEQVKSVQVKFQQQEPLVPDVNESYFANNFEKWVELNRTKHFSDFSFEVQPLCRDFNLVLLNKAKLSELLLTYLKISNEHSAEPLLSLVVDLARDLQNEFSPFITMTLTGVLDVFKRIAKNADVFKWAHSCLNFLVRNLWKCFIEQFEGVYPILASYLDSKRSEHVRFVAETLSFLLRKANDQLPTMLEIMLNDCIAFPMRVQGVGLILFETVKGVMGQFNSCVTEFIGTCLQLPFDSEPLIKVKYDSLQVLIEQITKYTDKNRGKPILDLLLLQLRKPDNVAESLRLFGIWVKARQGLLIPKNDGYVSLFLQHISLTRQITDGSSRDSFVSTLLEVLSGMLSVTPALFKPAEQRTLIQAFFYEVDLHYRLTFAEKFFSSAIILERQILPLLLNYTDELDFSRLENELNSFAIRQFWVRYTLSRISLDSIEDKTVALRPKRLSFFEHLIDGKRVLSSDEIWTSLVCLSALENVDQKAVVRFCEGMFRLTKECLMKLSLLPEDSTEKRRRWNFVYYTLVWFLCRFENGNHLPTVIDSEAVVAFIRSDAGCYFTLRAADLYVSAAPEVSKPNLLDELFPILRWNLAFATERCRCCSLSILSKLASPGSDDLKLTIFETCLMCDKIPLDLEHQRLKIAHLGKLTPSLSTPALPSIENSIQIPLLFLFGQLHSRLTLMHEPVRQLITQHALALSVDSLWAVLEAILEKAFANSTESDGLTAEGDLFLEQAVLLEGDLTNDFYLYRVQLLKTMVLFPSKCEPRSRILAPLFISFFRNEYKRTMADQTLPIPEDSGDRKLQGRSRANCTNVLLGILELFAKFTNPVSLFKADELIEIYLELLSSRNNDIQKQAFACLKQFKWDFVKPYVEHLDNLMDDRHFKSELILLGGQEERVVNSEHLESLVPLLMRILYGRMLQGKKESRQPRKLQVIRFLQSMELNGVKTFLGLVFSPFRYNIDDLSLNISITSAGEMPPLVRQRSALDVLKTVLKEIGDVVKPFLPNIFQLLMNFAFQYNNMLVEQRDKLLPSKVSHVKAARGLVATCVFSLFAKFLIPVSEKQTEQLFDVMIFPQLTKFSNETLTKPTPLLKLFHLWSQHSQYFHLLVVLDLNDMSPLKAVIDLMSNPHCDQKVIDTCLKLLINLASKDEDLEEEVPIRKTFSNLSLETPVDGPYTYSIAVILNHFEKVLEFITQVLTGTRSKRPLSKHFQLLSLLSPFAAGHSDSMVNVLLAFLNTNATINDSDQLQLLTSVTNLIPNLTDPIDSVIGCIGPLLSSVTSRVCRLELCRCIEAVASTFAGTNSDVKLLAAVIRKTNSWDKRRVEEPDYSRRLDGFKDASSFLHQPVTLPLSSHFWSILLHNCFFLLRADNDMSLRDSASDCALQTIGVIKEQITDEHQLNLLLDNCVLPQLYRGFSFQTKDDLVRNEFVSLLVVLVRLFPDRKPLSELSALLHENKEQDFFENVKHVQQHRRTKAFNRLTEFLKSHRPHVSNLVSILLPMASYHMLNEPYSKNTDLVDSALSALAMIYRYLPWIRYKTVLQHYLKLFSTTDRPKLIIRVICCILNSFHFLDETGDQKEAADQQPDGADTNETTSEVNDDGNESTPLKKRTKASSILGYISGNIIPQLTKLIAGRRTFEEITGSEVQDEVIRVPVALALVKLLQRLPGRVLDDNLSSVLLRICEFLRSKLHSVREIARNILVDIAQTLGTKYIPEIVRELRLGLTRGFQIYVLSATVHSLLASSKMQELLQPGDLDRCLQPLLDIWKSDLLAEREHEGGKKIPEAKGDKSSECYQIAAKLLTDHSIPTLIDHMKELAFIRSQRISDIVEKVFLRITKGMMSNSSLQMETILVCVYTLCKDLEPSAPPRPGPGVETNLSRRPPSSFLLEPEPQRPNLTPIVNKRTGSHLLVQFALRALHSVLKRCVLCPTNSDHLKLLDPYVTILVGMLSDKNVKVASISLRCLAKICRFPLPTLERNLPAISKGIFAWLNTTTGAAASGDNMELLASAFKCLTVLIRDVNAYEPSAIEMDNLIAYAEELIGDSKQNLAFDLIKAVLSRKVANKVISELMSKVGTIAMKSVSSETRLQARQCVIQYLLEYPLKQKVIIQKLEFFVSYLSYETVDGRTSAMELIATVLSSFPEALLTKLSGLFFVPLALSIVSDRNPTCRNMAAKLVQLLLEKLAQEDRDKLFDMTVTWLREDKVQMVSLGAQLCGFFVDVEAGKFVVRLQSVVPLVYDKVSLYFDPLESEDTHSVDYCLYNLLLCLLKIQKYFCDFGMKEPKYIALVWKKMEACLLHPHCLVRLVSCQLFGTLFTTYPLEDVVGVGQSNFYLSDNLGSNGELLASKFVRQLSTQNVSKEMCSQILKNLVYLGQVFHKANQAGTFEVPNMLWLLKKLTKRANAELVKTPNNFMIRVSVVQFYGVVVSLFAPDEVAKFMDTMLPVMCREMESRDPELREIDNEILNLLKVKIGVPNFSAAFSNVQQTLKERRDERKQKRAAQSVTDPEIGARRQIRKQLKKKEAKKRKQLLLRPERSVKIPRLDR